MLNDAPSPKSPPGENVRYFSKRLLKALQAMPSNPLTLVEAPAGYGKSVAVKDFLDKARVTLIMAAASQTSPESFWPDFCRSLAKKFPGAGDECSALLRLGFPRDGWASERVAPRPGGSQSRIDRRLDHRPVPKSEVV